VKREIGHCLTWAAPALIIPKKYGYVGFISDFREAKENYFHFQKTSDLMLKLKGIQSGTSLDSNMGYYHIKSNSTLKRLCTIV